MDFKSTHSRVNVKTTQGIMNYEVEQRIDPLLKYSSVICEHLLDKWGNFYGNRDEKFIKNFVDGSKKNCPFCKPTPDKIAARFVKSQMDDEILKFNCEEGKSNEHDDCVYIFPNIYPRTDFDVVVTMPSVHYLNLNEFKDNILKKFFNAEVECVKRAYLKNKNLNYANVGWNYLFPSGASLTHLHMQIMMRETPFSHVASLINASREYKHVTGKNFWDELMKGNDERKIFENEKIYLYAPFAPQGFSEVRCIINKKNLMNMDEKDINEISMAIEKILSYYHGRGFSSFNFAMFSDGLNDSNSNFDPDLPVSFTICARPNPEEIYTSIDTWYMPFLLRECVVLEKPENLAKKMRMYFIK